MPSAQSEETKYKWQYKAVEEDLTYRHMVIADERLEESLHKKNVPLCEELHEAEPAVGEMITGTTVAVLPGLLGCQVCTKF